MFIIYRLKYTINSHFGIRGNKLTGTAFMGIKGAPWQALDSGIDNNKKCDKAIFGSQDIYTNFCKCFISRKSNMSLSSKIHKSRYMRDKILYHNNKLCGLLT